MKQHRNNITFGLFFIALLIIGIFPAQGLSVIPDPDNVLQLDFSEQSGTIIDSSQYHNNGQVHGDIRYSQEGIIGKGLYFNSNPRTGLPAYVDFGSDTTFLPDGAKGFSYSFWMKTDKTQNSMMATFKEDASLGWYLQLDHSGDMTVYVNGDRRGFGEGVWETLQTDLIDDAWHHIAFTVDEEQVNTYLDGQLISTIDAQISRFSAGNANFRIGTSNHGLYYGYEGLIDEVDMWTRTLHQEEITKIHEKGREVQTQPVRLCSTLLSDCLAGEHIDFGTVRAGESAQAVANVDNRGWRTETISLFATDGVTTDNNVISAEHINFNPGLFDLDAEENERVTITANVPAHQKSGIYKGELLAKEGNTVLASATYVIEVESQQPSVSVTDSSVSWTKKVTEAISTQVTVKNTGNIVLKNVHVLASSPIADVTSSPGGFSLQPEESRTITLYIANVDETKASHNYEGMIKVHADNLVQCAANVCAGTLNIHLEDAPAPVVQVFPNTLRIHTQAGESKQTSLQLKNTGQYDLEEVEVTTTINSVYQPQVHPNQFSLAKDETKDILFGIHIPSSIPPGVHQLGAVVYTVDGKEVGRTAVSVAIEDTSNSPSPQPSIKELPTVTQAPSTVQGQSGQVTLEIENDGNVDFDSIHVTSQQLTSVAGNANPSVFTLNTGDTRQVVFSFSVPENMAPGTYNIHHVRVKVGQDVMTETTIQLTVLEKPQSGQKSIAAVPTIEMQGQLGETISKEISVTNDGTLDISSVVVEHTIEEAHQVTLSPAAFSLSKGETQKVLVQVHIPTAHAEGTTTIGSVIILTEDSGSKTELDRAAVILTVEEESESEPRIASLPGTLIFGNGAVTPGSVVSAQLTIKNTGSVTINPVTLVSTAGQQYQVDFAENDFSLEAGNSKTVTVQLEVPEDEGVGEHIIGDVIVYTNGKELGRTMMQINVKDSSTPPPQPSETDATINTFKFKNNGLSCGNTAHLSVELKNTGSSSAQYSLRIEQPQLKIDIDDTFTLDGGELFDHIYNLETLKRSEGKYAFTLQLSSEGNLIAEGTEPLTINCDKEENNQNPGENNRERLNPLPAGNVGGTGQSDSIVVQSAPLTGAATVAQSTTVIPILYNLILFLAVLFLLALLLLLAKELFELL